MIEYIKKYRNLGYKDLIQVVKIKVDKSEWFFDSKKTIGEDLIGHGYNGHNLLSVKHYIDEDHNLDVTQLEFKKDFCGLVSFNNSYNNLTSDRDQQYYKKIRKYIGNKVLFSCGMSVIIKNRYSETAIAKRSDDKTWAFPAGGKELSEPILETLNSEVMEELGIEIKNPILVAIISGDSFKVTYANGHKMHYISFIFKADYKSGELRVNDHENSAVEWVKKDKLYNIVSDKFISRQKLYESYKGIVLVP